MIKENINYALNEQLNYEYASAYMYLSMQAYFESINLSGFAHWMNVQNKEEMAHVAKFFAFINERGGRVTLSSIEKPEANWESPLIAFEETLAHEIAITDRINTLVDMAIKEKDHASNNFLQWFVAEQVEEESTVEGIIARLKMLKDAPDGLFLMDKELAQRVYIAPI